MAVQLNLRFFWWYVVDRVYHVVVGLQQQKEKEMRWQLLLWCWVWMIHSMRNCIVLILKNKCTKLIAFMELKYLWTQMYWLQSIEWHGHQFSISYSCIHCVQVFILLHLSACSAHHLILKLFLVFFTICPSPSTFLQILARLIDSPWTVNLFVHGEKAWTAYQRWTKVQTSQNKYLQSWCAGEQVEGAEVRSCPLFYFQMSRARATIK